MINKLVSVSYVREHSYDTYIRTVQTLVPNAGDSIFARISAPLLLEDSIYARFPADIAVGSQQPGLRFLLLHVSSFLGFENLFFEIRVEQRLERMVRAVEFGPG